METFGTLELDIPVELEILNRPVSVAFSLTVFNVRESLSDCFDGFLRWALGI